ALTARNLCPPAGSTSMRENVLLGPALEVKQRTIWQEIEASPSQLDAVLPGQHRIETAAQRVQVQNVRSGVTQLLLGQCWCAPMRAQLLCGSLDAELVSTQSCSPVH